MAALRQRYLRDPFPVRLGGLAANLARIRSFSNHLDHGRAVRALVRESEFLIEWAAPEAEPDRQAVLAALQLELALWQRDWESLWLDNRRRRSLAQSAAFWSSRILEIGGLAQE